MDVTFFLCVSVIRNLFRRLIGVGGQSDGLFDEIFVLFIDFGGGFKESGLELDFEAVGDVSDRAEVED